MQFIPSVIIPSVIRIIPQPIEDKRGFFLETWDYHKFADATGIYAEFANHCQSRSVRRTLRGLHYQEQNPQGKLIQVLSGNIFDVVVDLRRESPTFSKWVGTELSVYGTSMLWVPPGFAHGFLVHSASADVSYHCTHLHDPADARAIRWNDSTLGIKWPLEKAPILSDKDAHAPSFVDYLTSS